MIHNSKKQQRLAQRIVYRQQSIVRRDIADWQNALRSAGSASNPRFVRLQELYNDIARDAHLASQIQLRKSKTLGADFVIVSPQGKILEKETSAVANMPVVSELMNLALDSLFYGITLVELSPKGLQNIDRRHLDPRNGLVYLEQYDDSGIPYRQLPQYGKTLIEFCPDPASLGIYNQAVPHVLYRRFAQACWSELCEIYGTPPRYIKTDEQDPQARLDLASTLANTGSAPVFLLGTGEEVGFVPVNNTGGEVYENLIRVCSNELSLLINGAVLGQDTKNGSNAKEETSNSINNQIAFRDQYFIEQQFNTTVLPALAAMGLAPANVQLKFTAYEDTNALFEQTMQAAAYFDIDPEWVRKKFGIEVTGLRTFGTAQPLAQKNTANLSDRFFDPFA